MSIRALLSAYALAAEERVSLDLAQTSGAHYASYYRDYPARIARLDGLLERIAVRLERRCGERVPAAAGERA